MSLHCFIDALSTDLQTFTTGTHLSMIIENAIGNLGDCITIEFLPGEKLYRYYKAGTLVHVDVF